jgi:hypothetical protein
VAKSFPERLSAKQLVFENPPCDEPQFPEKRRSSLLKPLYFIQISQTFAQGTTTLTSQFSILG